MNGSSANCPEWLADRIFKSGGNVSFHQFMDWALNDEEHGAYSRGHLKLGPKGDFVTSPSLGPDFAELLAVQLVDWFEQLENKNIKHLPLSLIEVGPGEGNLIYDLIRELAEISPAIFGRLEVILVDINQGMVQRQKERLKSISTIPIRWLSFDELAKKPVIGVILAHEILDALPVERIVLRNNKLFRQGVKVEEKKSNLILSYDELPLSPLLNKILVEIQEEVGIKIPPEGTNDGWCSELHIEFNPWLKKAAESLIYGSLLIIDYALEAKRYYNIARKFGTLIAYKNQYASYELLQDPGYWDLTSHLCIETLVYFAQKNNWNLIGDIRQGQALLALGLAKRIYSLQKLPSSQLNVALERREGLLRLVDPACLGEFRWLAFEINKEDESQNLKVGLHSKFLTSPTE